MQAIQQLRFVFYTTDSRPSVKEIRELAVSASTDLKKLDLSLPEGSYQLVVLANPTLKIKELTALGKPLSALTAPTKLFLNELLIDRSPLRISMLNAGDPIAVAPEAFGSSAQRIQVTLEPTLARVLLYGEPTLASGATTGTAPAGYIVHPQALTEALLRPLGLIRSGGEESAGHRSSEADVYPRGPLFSAWESQSPTSLKELLTYFSLDKLQQTSGESFWTAPVADESKLTQLYRKSSCYARETTLPPKAYLTGAVPSLLIRYPYIPEGLTLTGDEGWVSFEGNYYTETQVKGWIKTKQFDDERLKQACTQAGLTESSFAQAFEQEGIAFHYRGYSYYTLPIRHYEDSKAPEKTSIGRYGLVRGNEYRIHLTRILRPGRALPPDLSTDLSPLAEEKSLSATLEVRPLTTRSSEAHL